MNIESRLAAVERQIKVQRSTIAGLLIALMALVGFGATERMPDVIRAKKFVVVNGEGQEIITMMSAKELGGPEDGILTVNNNAGKTLLYASADIHGFGTLVVGNNEGKMMIGVGADVSGNGRLQIKNNVGRDVILAGSTSIGEGRLTISNKEGMMSIGTGAGPHGGVISIYKNTGDSVIQAYADEIGMGYVGVFDRQGKRRSLTPR